MKPALLTGNNFIRDVVVSVTDLNGFAGQVDLGISGAPPNAYIDFDPPGASSVPAGGGAAIRIAVGPIPVGKSTPPGTYPLTITGISGALKHTATFTLVVTP